MSFYDSSNYILEMGDIPEGIKIWKQTNYDEKAIWDKVKSTGSAGSFQRLAIQLAVVGWGSKTYGMFFDENGGELDVEEFFNMHGFKTAYHGDEKPGPTDVTISRLVRLFRYHVQKYLQASGEKSYLFKKYCTETRCLAQNVFPGAEYLVTDRLSVRGIQNAYQNLDEKLGTSFSERLERVFQARGLLISEE